MVEHKSNRIQFTLRAPYAERFQRERNKSEFVMHAIEFFYNKQDANMAAKDTESQLQYMQALLEQILQLCSNGEVISSKALINNRVSKDADDDAEEKLDLLFSRMQNL